METKVGDVIGGFRTVYKHEWLHQRFFGWLSGRRRPTEEVECDFECVGVHVGDVKNTQANGYWSSKDGFGYEKGFTVECEGGETFTIEGDQGQLGKILEDI